MRLLSAEGSVPLENLAAVRCTTTIRTKVADPDDQGLRGACCCMDDSANLSMTEMRAKARRLKQRQGLRLIIINYLQLISSGRRVESRQVEVSEFSRRSRPSPGSGCRWWRCRSSTADPGVAPTNIRQLLGPPRSPARSNRTPTW